MVRSVFVAMLIAFIPDAVSELPSVRAQDAANLGGKWTLNRALSEFPREIGFTEDWMTSGASDPGASGGGRSRRGGSTSAGGRTATGFPSHTESADEAKRLQALTAEVRNPSAQLTIVDAPAAVTITDDRGQTRTFRPDGSKDVLQLDTVSIGVTARRDDGRLVIAYDVAQGRTLRYTYSRDANRPGLIVDVEFVERGGGDKVRRIYEPANANEAQATNAPSPGASKSAAPSPQTMMPGPVAREAFNQQPDAELKGLTKLGLVVEDLSSQAAACGLRQDAIETAVSKRLSAAGFTVRANSDEDTYLYIAVSTANLSTGLCVSRYDAFLYTHTTARLSYQQTPVLVQVELLHKGGLTGGGSAAHAEAVLRGVQEYVDQFAARIHGANK